MAERNKQIARVYSLLNLLDNSSASYTVTELCEKLKDRDHEASKRTIYRELEALQMQASRRRRM